MLGICHNIAERGEYQARNAGTIAAAGDVGSGGLQHDLLDAVTWFDASSVMIKSYLHAAADALWRNGDRFAAPAQRQAQLLRELLRTAAGTEWGREHDFDALAETPDVVRAYQQRVSLSDYEDFRDPIERMRRGEEDVLWPGAVDRYGVSSGTASDGKVLPAPDAALRSKVRGSADAAFSYVVSSRGGWSLFGGKTLTLPGRVERDPNYPGTLVGEGSALFSQRTASWFQHLYQAVPNEDLVWAGWKEKLRAVARRTVDTDVRAVVSVPSWMPVLFDMLREAYAERHGRSPATIREVWPNVRVFFSGGVALHPYRSLLERELGPVDFVESYAATEGFFAFQDHPDEDMLLHLDSGVFYEFVKVDDLDHDRPRRYTVEEVEPGVRYALFVTANCGLWAYCVGDVVRFTSTFPHRLVVAGRLAEMMDRYGEALFAEETRAALNRACQETGATVREYHVSPRTTEASDGAPRHQWLLEFERPPASQRAFARLLDKHLCTTNRHYEIRRKTDALRAPEVVALPRGTFHRWLEHRHETVSAQTKVPRIADDRHVADPVMRLADEATRAT